MKLLSPAVMTLARSLQDAFEADNFVNLYAAWHSCPGFDIHWDAQDSLIVQVAGRKRWQLFKPTREALLEDDVDRPPRPSGSPIWEGILEQGHVLYIPRGWWHGATAMNCPSLHLTFASIPLTGVDYLQWIVRGLRAHAVVRADLPRRDRMAYQADRVAQLRSLVLEAISDDSIRCFRGEPLLDAAATPYIRLPAMPYTQAMPLSAETQLRLASAQRIRFTKASAGRVQGAAAGSIWECESDLVPALQELSDLQPLSIGKLMQYVPARHHAALTTYLAGMVAAGIVMVEPSTTTPAP